MTIKRALATMRRRPMTQPFFDEITSRKAALKLLAAVDEMDSSVLNIKTTASKVQKLLEIDRAYEWTQH